MRLWSVGALVSPSARLHSNERRKRRKKQVQKQAESPESPESPESAVVQQPEDCAESGEIEGNKDLKKEDIGVCCSIGDGRLLVLLLYGRQCW